MILNYSQETSGVLEISGLCLKRTLKIWHLFKKKKIISTPLSQMKILEERQPGKEYSEQTEPSLCVPTCI